MGQYGLRSVGDNYISPGCSLEGLMLKLTLQYFGHLIQKTDIGKDPDAEKD